MNATDCILEPHARSASPQLSLWDIVDAALVINLDHRTDRWNRIQQHLSDIVPRDKLHRVSAVAGKLLNGYETSHWFRRTHRPASWAGRAGCSVSHRDAMRIAVERGWNWVMLIEDDAEFSCSLNGAIGDHLSKFLTQHGDQFGFVYLGFDSPRGPVKHLQQLDGKRRLYQIGGASTTHAYIVNRRVMQKLLSEFPQSNEDIWSWTARHVVIDRWYSLNLYRWTNIAAVSPLIALQEPSQSDITQRTSDFQEDTTTDILAAIQDTPIIANVKHVLKSTLRPLTMLPHQMKAIIRRQRGF